MFPVEVIYAFEQGTFLSIPTTMITDRQTDATPIKTTLFKEFGSIGTRKLMAFKRQTDFEFDLKYGKTADEQDK